MSRKIIKSVYRVHSGRTMGIENRTNSAESLIQVLDMKAVMGKWTGGDPRGLES